MILRMLVAGAIVVLGLFVPRLLGSSYYVGLLINAVVLGIAATSIGFLAHHCGLIAFGAAGLTGGAAYLFAIGVSHSGWSATQAALFCLVASPAVCALVGALIVTARPLPFAMLTLALAQMMHSVVTLTDLRHLTGGSDGLTLSWQGRFFGLTQSQLAKADTFWPVAWLALCAVLLLVWGVGRSRFGQVLRAIRANEERMRFSGFGTFVPRVLAFTLAGFIAAVAGLLTALNSAFVSPELLDFGTGGMILVAMLIGGASSAIGPVLGAVLYVFGQDRFGVSGHLELLTGIAVVAVVATFRGGAMGFVRSAWARLQGGGPAGLQEAARAAR